jgi:hypothetical protein
MTPTATEDRGSVSVHSAQKTGNNGKTDRLALIAAGVALSLVATMSSCENLKAGATDTSLPPTTEAPNQPETTTTEFEIVTTTTEQGEQLPITVENLELDASLMDDPQALIETFINDRITQWYSAGSTPETFEASLRVPGEWIDIAPEFTAQSDPIFIEALLIENWRDVPSIVEFVDQMEKVHVYNLAYYLATYDTTEDAVPYMRSSEVTALIDSTRNSDGSLSVKAGISDSDNSDQNRVGEELTGGKPPIPEDKNYGEPVFTFVTENGKIKISNIILSVPLEQ